MNNYFLDKRILIISPEPWDSLFVSKHHYAIELAKNNQVLFTGPPSSRYEKVSTRYPNVQVLFYKPFVPGLRFLPSVISRYWIRLKLKQLEKMAGGKFDCIWSFDNSVFFDFSILDPRTLSICHVVDAAQDFQLATAASTANLCLGVSEHIVNKLKQYNKRVYRIAHGVDLVDPLKPVTLPGRNTVKAIYAGNLNSKFLDRTALFRLMDAFPTVDFIFIGSGGDSWEHRENAFFLGQVDYQDLPSYLSSADIQLLVYDTKRFKEHLTNAHKVLVYLGVGKAIVSSFVGDYAERNDLLQMSRTNDDLISTFGQVVENLGFHNSDRQMQIRQQYASHNTYAKRIAEIDQIVMDLLS